MRRFRLPLLLLLASLALSAIALLRGGEYDEFYTIFLLAGNPRPAWPARPFHPPEVRADFTGSARAARIATALRRDDVHPPLYFWLAKYWRAAFGPSLLALRLLSVLCAIIGLALLARIAAALGIDPPTATLLSLGCYGFAYSSIVARDFSLAALLILAGLLSLLRSKPTPAAIFSPARCSVLPAAPMISLFSRPWPSGFGSPRTPSAASHPSPAVRFYSLRSGFGFFSLSVIPGKANFTIFTQAAPSPRSRAIKRQPCSVVCPTMSHRLGLPRWRRPLPCFCSCCWG
jgi:hypothetical protein